LKYPTLNNAQLWYPVQQLELNLSTRQIARIPHGCTLTAIQIQHYLTNLINWIECNR